jgi:hypothetical protein
MANILSWFTDFLKKVLGITTNTTTTESTTTKNDGANKQALCMGINDYLGTQNDLRGCINDAMNWGNLLKTKYGYNITTLLDSQVTRANVIDKIKHITQTPGLTHFVLTYSGHGSQVIDSNNDEADGKDETLYLYDGNLVDDDIREILSQIPAGVKVAVISDSCHSGTVTRAFLNSMNDTSFYSKPRYMPPEDLEEVSRLEGVPFRESMFYPEECMNHVLISGAKDTEYSYDAKIGGQPCGAFTYYALKVLQDNPVITYNDFITKLRTYLPSSEYPQTPQLEGKEVIKQMVMFD